MGMKVNLKKVRVAWLYVFDKKPGQKPDEKPAYRMDVIIDKDDHNNIQKLDDAALAVMTDAFKSEKAAEKWLKRESGLEGNISKDCAIKDGDERDNLDEAYEGKFYITTKSFKQPRVLTSDGEETRDGTETLDGDDLEGTVPYGGCYCNVSIELWGQNNDKGKGLRCNLLGLKFVEDGEAYGGSGSSERANDDDLDDDEDDAPRGRKSKSSRRTRDDEDERPRRSRRSHDDEDEEDERPRRRRSRDDEDEDERPRRRR